MSLPIPEVKTIPFKGDYIGGEFRVGRRKDEAWEIVSPADTDDKVIAIESFYDHVDQACLAAEKAYLPWARKPQAERVDYLMRLKAIFEARKEEMAELISREMGKPLWESRTEAAAIASKIAITVEHSAKLIQEERVVNALPSVDGVIRYKPRGVMAVLGPFNFPAHLPNGHVIPALLAGNTVVMKPSDKTPAVGQLYAEMIHEAGFPQGVFNLVQGKAEVGRRLVRHEKVDGILFTGSYEVGLKIKQDTNEHYWKILALEMGGKNTTVVWSDADIPKAVYETLVGAYMTTGQRCSCTSRIVLHPNIREKFMRDFHDAAKQLEIGHWSQNVFMGPLAGSDSAEKYLRFLDIAKREGAEILMRGKSLERERQGSYVTPSIFLVQKLDTQSVYQRTEIFGPNVAVYTTDDFSEAMKIVNHAGYGLVTALFSENEDLYRRTLLEAKVGLVNWNRTTNGASSRLPFGGIGKSGNDRPSGHFAVQYCTIPVASLEDRGGFDSSKILPGIKLPS